MTSEIPPNFDRKLGRKEPSGPPSERTLREIERENFWAGVWIMFWIFNVILACAAFYAGIDQATDKGSCRYASFAEFHPARVLGCELFRKRFE